MTDNTQPTLPVIIEGPAEKEPSSEFDWNDPECVVLVEQRRTAVYWNPKGELVIRQQCWPDEDALIFISPDSVDEFIDKLTDKIGIPSIGKPG
jgi:hypothetical protein